MSSLPFTNLNFLLCRTRVALVLLKSYSCHNRVTNVVLVLYFCYSFLIRFHLCHSCRTSIARFWYSCFKIDQICFFYQYVSEPNFYDTILMFFRRTLPEVFLRKVGLKIYRKIPFPK